MKPYRIITNGYRYRIQRRVWLFFWRDMLNESGDKPLEFRSLAEARMGVARLQRQGLVRWLSVTESGPYG